jgi:hypothetical protein
MSPTTKDRGGGDILRFVGRLLVGSPRQRLGQFSCSVCCGRFLVGRFARYRGGATFWPMSEDTEAATARASREAPTSENSAQVKFAECIFFPEAR